MEGHAEHDRADKVHVCPKREHEERLILRERVASVEHFDH